MARSVDARAFTFGSDIVLAKDAYSPTTPAGRDLLTHEVVHTIQQSRHTGSLPRILRPSEPGDPAEVAAEHVARAALGRASTATTSSRPGGVSQHPAPGTLQRVPAAPTTSTNAAVPFDRSSVAISEIPDITVFVVLGTAIVAPFPVTVRFASPDVNHLAWELYDPSDNMTPGSFGTIPGTPNAVSTPFVISSNSINARSKQGRYLLRCVGYKDRVPIVYADRSFFMWTTVPPANMDLTALNAIKAAPAQHSLGEVGAAYARSMMLEHQAAVKATGTGTYMGSQCPAPPAGATKHDCTTYVLEVLKQAFTAKGLAADWKIVVDQARKASGGKFKGTELIDALVDKAGWKAVFWSPDPRNPSDKDPEHPTAYKDVRAKGTYYGIPVDATKSVIDYRPTSSSKQEVMSGLDQLKSVPLAVIAARGGKHMTLLINGIVYEVHWDRPPTDPDVIEATPLEKWAWLSGVIVMPP